LFLLDDIYTDLMRPGHRTSGAGLIAASGRGGNTGFASARQRTPGSHPSLDGFDKEAPCELHFIWNSFGTGTGWILTSFPTRLTQVFDLIRDINIP
jgi:hypothetical protein